MKWAVGLIWLIIIFLLFMMCFQKGHIDRFAAKILCDTKIPPEDQRKVIKATINYQPDGHPQTFHRKIPRIIMQTNEKDMIPEEMAKCSQTLIEKNPDCEYVYFNDDRARTYIAENFPENIVYAYDKLKPGAYRADLFRYCFLYKNGGIYVDTGMKELISLKDLIHQNDSFISPEDNNTGGLYNAFICCCPSHPIIKEVLNECISNIERENYGKQPLDITGPTAFARAFKKVTGSNVIPNTRYKNGIRVIKYIRTGFCNTSGEIWDGDKLFFITRYPTYHVDAAWYNTQQHYSDMWRQHDVFRSLKEISLIQHQQNLMRLFKIFIKFAEKHNLQWWSTGGTLLGAIRGQNIIPWDDDIDIEVPKKTISYLLTKHEELKRMGIKFDFDDYIWRLRFLNGNKAYMDLFEVEKTDNIWRFTEEENNYRWPRSYMKNSELFPLKEYKFGDLTIKGPNNPIPYLERQYKDWKIPVKEVGHHNF